MSNEIFTGNVIEAAKLSNVSKILGRSKSEDSVYNSMNSPTVQQGIKVSYAQDTGQYSSDNNSTSSAGTTLVNGVHGEYILRLWLGNFHPSLC